MSQANALAHADATEEQDEVVFVDPRVFLVDIEGYEGPLDLLLSLARDQKVDLREISIVRVADQYLEFIARAREASLDLAAEYLVMAAWLAYLKSRLLLPEPEKGAEEELPSSVMAEALSFQLRRLDAMRTAGAELFARPLLGRHMFLRGYQESDAEPERSASPSAVGVELSHLLKAYGSIRAKGELRKPMALGASELYTMDDALNWIRRNLGGAPDWETLTRYLPPGTLEDLREGSLRARSALASTFLASLELTRRGILQLRQSRPFGPIFVRALEPSTNVTGDE